jgi:hypothetical protein
MIFYITKKIYEALGIGTQYLEKTGHPKKNYINYMYAKYIYPKIKDLLHHENNNDYKH